MEDALTLVGAYPPPYGGVSVHVHRLFHLVRPKFAATVLDLYAPRSAVSEPGVVLCGSRFPGNIARALWHLHRRRARIVHFHVSSLARFSLAAPFFYAAAGRGTRLVATIHGGALRATFLNFSTFQRAIAAWSLRRLDHIVAVSEEQRLFLQEHMLEHDNTSVIPAFLPPPEPVPRPALSAELMRLRGDGRRVVLASGFGLPLYGFHLLLEAIQGSVELRRDVAVIIVMYNRFDAGYVDSVTEALQGLPHTVFKDLAPSEFAYLLANIDIFIRPTEWDGDASSLREAGYFGRQIVASDCVARPHGAALFTSLDSTALREVLLNVLKDPAKGLIEFDFQENADHICALYEKLLSEPQSP